MQSLQDTLQQLRQFKIPLNPPATITELTRLQTLIHHSLPAELHALYLDHNGHDLMFDPLVADDAETVGLLFRLLSIAERDQVINDVMRTDWFAELPEILDRLLPCWSDDNGNYMVYYLLAAEGNPGYSCGCHTLSDS